MDNRRINIYTDCASTLMVDSITVTEEGNHVYDQNDLRIGSVWMLGSTGGKMYALYNGEYEISGTGSVKIEYMNNGYYEKIVEYDSKSESMLMHIDDFTTRDVSCIDDTATKFEPSAVWSVTDLFELNSDE